MRPLLAFLLLLPCVTAAQATRSDKPQIREETLTLHAAAEAKIVAALQRDTVVPYLMTLPDRVRRRLCRILISLARAIATSGSGATATAPSAPTSSSRRRASDRTRPRRVPVTEKHYPMATWVEVLILNDDTGEAFHQPLNHELT